jgi:hypothetical protein
MTARAPFDPARPAIAAAALAAKRTGGVFLALGLLGGGGLGFLLYAQWHEGTSASAGVLATASGVTVVLLGLAGCCFGFVGPLRAGRPWAAVALAAIGLLAAAAGAALFAGTVYVTVAARDPLSLMASTVVAGALVGPAVPLAAYGYRSFRAIEAALAARPGRPTGFEPVMRPGPPRRDW